MNGDEYEHPTECPPAECRAGRFACCAEANEAGGARAASHWALYHRPLYPSRFGHDGMLVHHLPLDDDSPHDPLVSCHGTVQELQPGVFGQSDAVVADVTPGAAHRSVMLQPDYERPVPPLVQEFWGSWGYARLLCVQVKSADPLFRSLPFDERWPLPDVTKKLMVLTASQDSAGWTDLGDLLLLADLAHVRVLHHGDAQGTARALVGALDRAAARASAIGGVVLTRGGGAQDWRQPFDAPEVTAAVRRAQAAGVPVMTGLGHESEITEVEMSADFAWGTPSQLGRALIELCRFHEEEQAASEHGLAPAVYERGHRCRVEFDTAWTRWHLGESGAVIGPTRPSSSSPPT